MKENIEQEIDEEMIEEMRDEQQEDSLENSEDLTLEQLGIHDGYGAPEPEERHNQYTFLHRAAYGEGDTVRTTHLNEFELGKPLLSVRTLLDLHHISRFYLDELFHNMNLDPNKENKIATYFYNKTQNITSSGMSKDGFTMNLNSTKRMDIQRKRIKDYSQLENSNKGGRK